MGNWYDKYKPKDTQKCPYCGEEIPVGLYVLAKHTKMKQCDTLVIDGALIDSKIFEKINTQDE